MSRIGTRRQNYHLFLRVFLRRRLYALHQRVIKRRAYSAQRVAEKRKADISALHGNITRCRRIVEQNRVLSHNSGSYILTALATEALDMALMSAAFVVDYRAKHPHKLSQ